MDERNTPNNGKAIAGLVLGIVSLVLIFIPYGSWFGLVLAIVGLIMSIQAKKESPNGMATAGMILSIIALVVCGLAILACGALVGLIAGMGVTM